MSEWIKQSESSLLEECSGDTVLIKFKDDTNGITINDGRTVDISWTRCGGDIIATEGTYSVDDIDSWKLII